MPDPPDRSTQVIAGRRPVVELLRAGKHPQRVLVAENVRFAGIVEEIRKLARAGQIPFKVVPRIEIDRLAGDSNHQGVVAVTGRYRYAPLESLLATPDPTLLMLDGISDPQNVGSLVRSAEVAGFSGLVLPSRRAVQVTPAVRRVSAGATEILPVARVNSLVAAVEQAKGAGLWAVGLDAAGNDTIWRSNLMEPPVALVLGSEGKGLSQGVKAHCDALVSIPLGGRIDSLNVAVAGAVAMFEVARRRYGSATL